MNNLENEKEIAKSIRKAAILKNWKLFKKSRKLVRTFTKKQQHGKNSSIPLKMQ